jgi:cold shock CspA family protein
LKSIGEINDCHKLWKSYSEEQKKQMKKAYFKINFLHGKISMNLPKYRKKAIELFKTALSLNNNDDDVKYNLAKTYYLEGEYKLAKENIPIGQKYYVLELDSFIDAKLGNYDTAISKIKNLLLKKEKGYLLRTLAEIYLCTENLELAFVSIKEAESIDKNNHKIYYTLGKIYYKYGLLKKALENLEKSVNISIRNFNVEFKDSIILKEEIQGKIINLNYTKDDDKLLNKLTSSFHKDLTKTGNILKYDNKRGFGFICKGKEKVFFHYSKCNYNNINVGDNVKFKTRKTNKGLEAFDIKKIFFNI